MLITLRSERRTYDDPLRLHASTIYQCKEAFTNQIDSTDVLLSKATQCSASALLLFLRAQQALQHFKE
jgi:hypothetical protein